MTEIPLVARTSEPAAASIARPWLCRIGLHTSQFGDGSACHSALRCNKCLTWIEPDAGADVDNCRRLVSEGRHPQRACFLPYDDAQRARSEVREDAQAKCPGGTT